MVCLQVQVIDDNNVGVGGGRWSQGLSHKDRGVVIGQGIDDAFKGSEMTTETEVT